MLCLDCQACPWIYVQARALKEIVAVLDVATDISVRQKMVETGLLCCEAAHLLSAQHLLAHRRSPSIFVSSASAKNFIDVYSPQDRQPAFYGFCG